RGKEGREYPWGNEAPDADRANYEKTNLRRVSPVGLFSRGSTPEGIADMAGNVWGGVEDKYDESSAYRVLRGGSWVNVSSFLRAAFRVRDHPGNRLVVIGFRCARE